MTPDNDVFKHPKLKIYEKIGFIKVAELVSDLRLSNEDCPFTYVNFFAFARLTLVENNPELKSLTMKDQNLRGDQLGCDIVNLITSIKKGEIEGDKDELLARFCIENSIPDPFAAYKYLKEIQDQRHEYEWYDQKKDKTPMHWI